MCFYNDDYDWCAEVHEKTRSRTNKRCCCFDCGEVIELYDWITHVFQQEHEECHCDACDMRDYLESGEVGEECWGSYGETFQCDICESCRLIRHAIYQVEKEEGCPSDARQPAYGELYETFSEHGNSLAYAIRAIDLFPDLVTNKMLKLAWKEISYV